MYRAFADSRAFEPAAHYACRYCVSAVFFSYLVLFIWRWL